MYKLLQITSIFLVFLLFKMPNLNGQSHLWEIADLNQSRRTVIESKAFLVNESILKTVLLNVPKEETKKVTSSTRLLPLPH